MKTVVMFRSEHFGRGDDQLGGKLMVGFLRKVWASDTKPDVMVFFNSGVKLLAEGSTVLDSLGAIKDMGVDIIACGVCVQHFELKDKLVLGRVSDMQEMVSTLMSADKVITV